MPRLYRVILPVSDIRQAEEFYSRVLGLPGKRVSAGRHYFDCGGTHATPNPDHVYFAMDDLEDCHRRAKLAGCKWIEAKIERRPWGERSFYAHDPFGNPICFVDEQTVFTG